jgi:hypothetical protein
MSSLVWNEIKELFFEQLKAQTKNPEILELGKSVFTWFEMGNEEEVEKHLQIHIRRVIEDHTKGEE